MPVTASSAAEDVLVIDDDSATVDAYARSLRRAGLGCLTAADGWQALELLSADPAPAPPPPTARNSTTAGCPDT